MRGRCAAAGLVVVAVIVAGCGAEDHPNEPRPPVPVELSAKVDNRKVVVVPDRVGAGLATITISNQSADDVEVSLDGPNSASTDAIPAGSVGSLQLELETGEYSVDSNVPTIASTKMSVGAPRPSAQNELLLP
jgi:hypothetical protein